MSVPRPGPSSTIRNGFEPADIHRPIIQRASTCRTSGHAHGGSRKVAHLAKDLADLGAGGKVATRAKDGVGWVEIVAMDGVGETELDVGRKGERAGCLWVRVSQSWEKRQRCDLDAVQHELFELGRCMTGVESSWTEPSRESGEPHLESAVQPVPRPASVYTPSQALSAFILLHHGHPCVHLWSSRRTSDPLQASNSKTAATSASLPNSPTATASPPCTPPPTFTLPLRQNSPRSSPSCTPPSEAPASSAV